MARDPERGAFDSLTQGEPVQKARFDWTALYRDKGLLQLDETLLIIDRDTAIRNLNFLVNDESDKRRMWRRRELDLSNNPKFSDYHALLQDAVEAYLYRFPPTGWEDADFELRHLPQLSRQGDDVGKIHYIFPFAIKILSSELS